MFDLTKLTPAPWRVAGVQGQTTKYVACSAGVLSLSMSEANAEFTALARNAFDVMMRRRWTVEPCGAMWYASACEDEDDLCCSPVIPWGQNPAIFADPFTALVEADKWYRENVETVVATVAG